MNKLKLSVGVLAFVGLAALNFSQSERGFVRNSKAQIATGPYSTTYVVSSFLSSFASSLSSYFTDKSHDCGIKDCTIILESTPDKPCPYPTCPGETGCCIDGNKKTEFQCAFCKPIPCVPKK
jgi:hypothetical protein